ncbi:hypothetical protein ACO2J1_04585 [Leptospira interrogans]|uniref:Uncharacterized protein n=6 Tax=Leptospira interrogans TaxID=173 RepID=A0AAP9WDV5_LEPIR|nr:MULTISPECIES: hypothetical protein [Leptospira]AKH77882.1 hypothetical protein BRAT_13035 [Leptospira interrogans serovar Bratislava]ALO01233.1 hypothetical protein LIH_12800 [Leptospira interrogans serovar Hardjo-prajitno]ARB97074.1 hypothetical protein A6J42_17785 [Leptospira interrogans serovar Copenhageni]ASP41826.1 hypothetical protein AMR47_08325 [Leptospira interrogans]ASV05809.1 hypothetical protein B2G47_06975 [Leptospira interrogans serovar Canicola]
MDFIFVMIAKSNFMQNLIERSFYLNFIEVISSTVKIKYIVLEQTKIYPKYKIDRLVICWIKIQI